MEQNHSNNSNATINDDDQGNESNTTEHPNTNEELQPSPSTQVDEDSILDDRHRPNTDHDDDDDDTIPPSSPPSNHQQHNGSQKQQPHPNNTNNDDDNNNGKLPAIPPFSNDDRTTATMSVTSSNSSLSSFGLLSSSDTTTTASHNIPPSSTFTSRWRQMARFGPPRSSSTLSTTTTTTHPSRVEQRRSRIPPRPRRRRRNLLPPPPTPSPALFLAQIQLLLYMLCGSTLLFLLAVLNTFAIVALTSTLLSMGMLGVTSYRYLLHTTSQENFTLYDLLPESLRYYLTVQFHEYMTAESDDPSFMERWRFLSLYVIPGLSPEQRESMARSMLSVEEREVVFAPGGFMRFLLGDGLYRRLGPVGGIGGGSSGGGDPMVTRPMISSVSHQQLEIVHERDEGTMVEHPPSQHTMVVGERRAIAGSNVDEGEDDGEDDGRDLVQRTSENHLQTNNNTQGDGYEEPPVTVRHAVVAVLHAASTLLFPSASPSEVDGDADDSEEEYGTSYNVENNNNNDRIVMGLLEDLSYEEEMMSNRNSIGDMVDQSIAASGLSLNTLHTNADGTNGVVQFSSSSGSSSSSVRGTVDGTAASASAAAAVVAVADQSRIRQNRTPPPRSVPIVSASLMEDLARQSIRNLLPNTTAAVTGGGGGVGENEIVAAVVSTAMGTYSSAAVDAATAAAERIVETNAPTVIRAGMALSGVSGVGLFGLLTNFVGGGGNGIGRRSNSSVNGGRGSGALTRRQTESSVVSDSGSSSGERSGITTGGRVMVAGLATTMFAGIASAGGAIMLRSYVRRTVAERRRERSVERRDDGGENERSTLPSSNPRNKE